MADITFPLTVAADPTAMDVAHTEKKPIPKWWNEPFFAAVALSLAFDPGFSPESRETSFHGRAIMALKWGRVKHYEIRIISKISQNFKWFQKSRLSCIFRVKYGG